MTAAEIADGVIAVVRFDAVLPVLQAGEMDVRTSLARPALLTHVTFVTIGFDS